MKRFFLLLLLMIILIAANSVVCAEQVPQQKIRIAAFNFYPTLFQAKDGSVKGFYVDFLDEIARREGWKIEYVYGNWADGLTWIKTGEVDVLTNVAFTNDRAAFLDYGKEPLLTVWSELYVPRNSIIDDIQGVSGKKIALMKGDFNAASFKNLVEQFGIPCQYVEYGNFEEVFKAIASRQVDGGVVNNTFGSAKYREYDIKSSGVIFNPFDIFLAVAKGKNSTVLSTLDRYLVEWRKSESSPYHQARERWSHGTASTIRVTHPWVKKFILISVAGLFVALAFIFMLRVQVRRKTFEIKNQLEERKQIEETLLFINNSGAKTRGDELLGTITSYLSRTLNVEYAFVGQLLPGYNRVRTRALFANGTRANDIEYDLHGTPCENVVGKNLCLYPREVVMTFPADRFLAEMDAEAYAASPLWDSQGVAIGLLGIISKKPIENTKFVETMIQMVATRVAQELEAMNRLDELSQSRKLLVNLANQVPGVVYQYRLYADGRSAFPYASQGMNDIYEVTPEEVREDATPVFGRLHPDDYNHVSSAIQESARTLDMFYCEFRVILPRQGLCWRWSQAKPERMPDGGTLWHGIISDITERKLAEEEKNKLEGQLQQAQKIEAVGRLAGGVAHDFNNMLSVILGHTEMALIRLEPSQSLYSSLSEIRKAAQRSSDLTRQLLAFARKQTVSPKVINLNETMAGMFSMLQRLIGENMQLTWQPATNLWPVKMDCSQVDQIMANLCVNARDAITDVGKVIIETKNCSIDENYCKTHTYASPGEYVKIVVSDDGKGMDKETIDHIFEPFYTTKGPGEGTGLGLATVYGIVRQNNGFINVYSEPGTGTTFTIYLPRYKGETEEAQQEVAAESFRRGHETILLVEDEEQILEMTALILTELGYRVLKADSPGEALRLALDYSSEIDLLITDVIMPEMNGRDLANNLFATYPQLKCLFMSGYTADIIAHHGVLEEGVQFIQKPFRINDLAAKLREILDGV